MGNEELKALQIKVTSLRAEGKYKETIEASYYLLEKGLEVKDYKSILIAHICKAASFYCIGDIEEAFFSIEAYNEVCYKHGDDGDWLNLYNILFLLYEFKKDFKQAKETLNKTIILGEKLKTYNIVSNAYSNLSHLYLLEEDYDQALKLAKIGLENAKLHTPKSEILKLRVKLNIAKAYIGLDQLDLSKNLIDEILVEPFIESLKREQSQCYDLLGTWYIKKELYKEAFESYTLAKQIVEEYHDVKLLQTIQEERCKLCELMNDVHLGYQVQKEYIALLKEINEREMSLAALKLEMKHKVSVFEKKASVDYLTGTYNRDYIESTVNNWLEQAAKNNERIVCIVFDIDNFKYFNDEYGHLFGDEIIKQVSQACSDLLKDGELIGRYGGDEFLVVLKNYSLEEGIEKALKIQQTIGELQIVKEGEMVLVQVSIGIADNSSNVVTSFADLFHFADIALYKSKKSGKNQISVNKF